jgi:hypothetical protein
MANNVLMFVPPNDSPVWLTNESLGALQAEFLKAIEAHGEGYAKFIVDGKLCKISMPVQAFYMENPAGGEPILIKPPSPPTFEESGQVVFLVRKPASVE